MDSKTIEEILTYLTEDLGGEWLLAGGGLVRLKFDARRGTEDLDLVRLRHATLSDEASRNELFKWLIARGLGPEWVNTAVEPFVREVSHWERETVILQTGTRGTILRPTLTLFIYLKLRRGTEIDLLDIEAAIPHCPEGFDEKKFTSWSGPDLRERLSKVRSRLKL